MDKSARTKFCRLDRVNAGFKRSHRLAVDLPLMSGHRSCSSQIWLEDEDRVPGKNDYLALSAALLQD